MSTKQREKVWKVQELRRSNASVPFKNKSKYTRKIKHRNKNDD